MMNSGNSQAALFDFDGTLRRGDSIVLFVRFALKRGALRRRELPAIAACALGAKIGLCPTERSKEMALRFEGRRSPAERERLCGDFASLILIPGLFPEGKRTWDALRAAGRRMVLASASTSDYMKYVSSALGADTLLCTQIDEFGSYKPCRRS